MKTLTAFLAMGVLFVLLLQVAPVLADDGPPDHRPEVWELTATAVAGGEPARPPRATATATATVQPYPIETPDPYPGSEAEGGFLEWLRRLLWKVE